MLRLGSSVPCCHPQAPDTAFSDSLQSPQRVASLLGWSCNGMHVDIFGESSTPWVKVEAAPRISALPAAILELQIQASQVVDYVFEWRPFIRVLIPAGLHQRDISVWHVLGHCRPIP